MTTKYIADGNTVDYDNTGSAIASGDAVVLADTGSSILGVALDDIAATTGEGVLAITGVFELPKATAAVIAQGGACVWDVSASNIDDDQQTAAAGDFICGTAVEAAGNGATTVKVKLNGFATANLA